MRFYNGTQKYHCAPTFMHGNMYCVLDQKGRVLLHRNLPTDPVIF